MTFSFTPRRWHLMQRGALCGVLLVAAMAVTNPALAAEGGVSASAPVSAPSTPLNDFRN